ncbi:MAG: hypothetical protein ACXACY_06905 [Candidatus Hodarchaeales archaeon]|jgi:hypothetical protein
MIPASYYIIMIAVGIASFVLIVGLVALAIRNYRRLTLLRFEANTSNLSAKILAELIVTLILCIINVFVVFGYGIYVVIFALLIGIIAGAVSKLKEQVGTGYRLDKERDWKSVAGRVGPVIILIEGIIFLIEGIINLLMGGFFWYAYYDIYAIVRILVLVSGITAISGIYSGFKRNKFARIICFIAGILALVILLFAWDRPYRVLLFSYILGLIYLDYVVIILFFIGGILCVISEDRFLNYYLDKSDFKKNLFDLETELDKIVDLEQFLKVNLSTDWEKIRRSFEAFKAGELSKKMFIDIALKNIGRDKLLSLFKKSSKQEYKPK